MFTFLFTDIEGSTRLWEQYPDAMRVALAQHDRILASAIEENRGTIFKTIGDAFCAVFDQPSDALVAAIAIQRKLLTTDWTSVGALKVRIAVQCAAVERRDNDYFGPGVNRVARILTTGHGGQILVSQSARDASFACLPAHASYIDLASHRLKDLGQPEHIWQLVHPDLESEFPRLRSLQAFANNIPIQVSSFVGREQEISTLRNMVQTNRLVTLTGAGGSGKTRLSLQVATELIESFTDGVWFIELASLQSPSQIFQQTASSLGVREVPDVPIERTLLDCLQNKSALLLFDNCEHLLYPVAALAEDILSECANVKILCTSREPLDIAGEHSWTIPTMPKPVDSFSGSEKGSASAMLQFDSVRLFVERARESSLAFTFNDGVAGAVGSICRRLDGIPLAIELAAATTRSLTPAQISDRLSDRFRFLTSGRRTAPERQKTLRGMIDWSYELLTASERALLPRLSVFSGGFTLDSAEQICSDDGVDRMDVADLIDKLVAKSLVVAHRTDRLIRYGLLESIREYGLAKLQTLMPEVFGELRRRHAIWCAVLADDSMVRFKAANTVDWLDVMTAEFDNFRSAFEYCIDSPNSGHEALKLASGYCNYFIMRGLASEGLRLTVQALQHPGATTANGDRANALNCVGNLLSSRGDFVSAYEYWEQALTIRRAIGDQIAVSSSLNNIGMLETRLGNFERAELALREALDISRAYSDKFTIANTCNNLGNCAKATGRYDTAKTYYSECLDVSRELGHRLLEAMSLNNLGCIELEECRFESAAALVRAGSELNRALGDRRQVAANLPDLALALLESGETTAAKETALEACSLAESVDDSHHRAHAVYVNACIELSLGNTDSALDLCKTCIEEFAGEGDRESLAKVLLTIAEIAAATNRYEDAAIMLSASHAIRESIGAPLPPREGTHADRISACIATGLTTAERNQCEARGNLMNLQAAADYALS